MNRRDFLKFVGSGLVVGPATVRDILATIPSALAAPLPVAAPSALLEVGLWQNVKWYVKEFDYGNQIGVGLSLMNPTTGKEIRNSVLFSMPQGEYGKRPVDQYMKTLGGADRLNEGLEVFPRDGIPDEIRAGEALLRIWAEEKGFRMPPTGLTHQVVTVGVGDREKREE